MGIQDLRFYNFEVKESYICLHFVKKELFPIL